MIDKKRCKDCELLQKCQTKTDEYELELICEETCLFDLQI